MLTGTVFVFGEGGINLLKVAHHGSSTSSIPQLLDEIKPQFAVISVGKFNRYRHPQNEVLNRLADEGTCVFRTDFNGAVSVYLDENGVTSAQLGRERTLMRLPRWLPRAQAGHCAATQ